METAELEYRLLQDKCTSLITELLKCGQQNTRARLRKRSIQKQPVRANIISGRKYELQNNYFFTAPDYLSVIDYLASERKKKPANVNK